MATGQQGMGPLSDTGKAKRTQPANEARHKFMTDLIKRAKKRAEQRMKDEEVGASVTYIDLRDVQ